MRNLRRGVDDQLVGPVIPVGDDGLAFKRHHRLPRHGHFALDHDGGIARMLLEAVVVVERQEEIVVPILVHARIGRAACRMRVDQRRKLVEIELDLFGEILGGGARRRDGHGDKLADKAHLALRQRVLHRRFVARHRARRRYRIDAGQIGSDEHRGFAVRRLGDAAQDGVRHGAAQESHLALVRQDDVGDIVAAAAEKAVVFLAGHPRAHALICHRLLSSRRRSSSAVALTFRSVSRHALSSERQSQNRTRTINLLVSLCFRRSQKCVLQSDANVGNGTLAHGRCHHALAP
jgi:hypothetical protein